MRLTGARVIKLLTDDGKVNAGKGTHVGKVYIVDLDSMQVASAKNLGLDCPDWLRPVIFDSFGNWIPTELVEICEAYKQ